MAAWARYSPKRATDTILPSYIGRLKKSSCPGPLTDDDAGCKTSFDHSTGGVEMFASDLLVPSEVLVKHHQGSSEDREECAETKDNNVSNSYTQGPVEVSREDEKTKCWCWRKAPKTQPGYN
mmetsp:Transcript_12119/g.22027  ORF Transcript_12119/g.22027 Transcript_12119/m.22027 type:complete len:122 (+) Transcript_12119:2368-2733(+)